MTTEDLILVGGGGHCKSVMDVALGAGFRILGVLDIKENIGKTILNTRIIGDDTLIPQYARTALFVITVGSIKNAGLRMELYDKIIDAGGKSATIIASDAYVSKFATIGEGSVVLHKACVNADAKIGKNCIINTFANIEHETEIGNFSHISTGAMINGACRIGNSVFVGSQSVSVQGISIVADTVIGAGTFVNKNISEKGIYAGNPMRKIK